MALVWSERFDTGINEIDNQHRQLVDIINKLLKETLEGSVKEELENTLSFLEYYIVRHFSEEEALQTKYSYPKLNEQHAEHEEFKIKLKELKDKFNQKEDDPALVITTENVVNKWWYEHITTLDKDLGNFLKEKIV